MDFQQWLFLVLAILGFLFGFYKWVILRGDKRRNELKTAHDLTLTEHSARLDRHSERINRMDDLIGLTRDEMLKNHPRIDHIEKLETSIDQKLDRVHVRLTGISRDLNKTIGAIDSTHQSEIAGLVSQIKNAIEKSND